MLNLQLGLLVGLQEHCRSTVRPCFNCTELVTYLLLNTYLLISTCQILLHLQERKQTPIYVHHLKAQIVQ